MKLKSICILVFLVFVIAFVFTMSNKHPRNVGPKFPAFPELRNRYDPEPRAYREREWLGRYFQYLSIVAERDLVPQVRSYGDFCKKIDSYHLPHLAFIPTDNTNVLSFPMPTASPYAEYRVLYELPAGWDRHETPFMWMTEPVHRRQNFDAQPHNASIPVLFWDGSFAGPPLADILPTRSISPREFRILLDKLKTRAKEEGIKLRIEWVVGANDAWRNMKELEPCEYERSRGLPCTNVQDKIDSSP